MAEIGQQYELGTLVGGTWKQWANSAGQDYYQNLANGATQHSVPPGYEDHANDTWAADNSKSWPQWRNNRTGCIRRSDPNAPPPPTYLHKDGVQAHLQLVERVPESHEYMCRRVIVAVLRFFFKDSEGFEVFQEESRGEIDRIETRPDMVVLKLLSRPSGSFYAYDYCMVETKKAGGSWYAAEDQLSRHCGGSDNRSKQVYGIIQVGLHVQFFSANKGILTAMCNQLHLRNDVNDVTNMLEYLKANPLPFI